MTTPTKPPTGREDHQLVRDALQILQHLVVCCGTLVQQQHLLTLWQVTAGFLEFTSPLQPAVHRWRRESGMMCCDDVVLGSMELAKLELLFRAAVRTCQPAPP